MPKPVIFILGFPASELRDANDGVVFPPRPTGGRSGTGVDEEVCSGGQRRLGGVRPRRLARQPQVG